MFSGISPQLWTLVTVVLGSFGVVFVPTPEVKSVIAAAAGLVVAVWQWQHHRTIRHADAQAAAIKVAQVNAAAAVAAGAAERTSPPAAAPAPGVFGLHSEPPTYNTGPLLAPHVPGHAGDELGTEPASGV